MKLLAPSIMRLCMTVKHEVEEEILANTVAIIDMHVSRLNHLQRQKLSCKEEVYHLESALAL